MFKTTDERGRAAAAVIADMRRRGCTLPPRTAAAVEAAEKATEHLAGMAAKGSPEVLAALLDRLIAGGKGAPTTGELVEALTALTMTERPLVAEAVTMERAGAVVGAMKAEGAELVEALRPTFDEAVAVLDEAAAVLVGVDDLDDVARVAAIGGDAAEQWKRAKAAEAELHKVRDTLVWLAALGLYRSLGDPRQRWLALADVDLAAFKRVAASSTAWQVRRLGRLSLADPAEHERRVAAIAAAWERDPMNPSTRTGPGVGQYPATVVTA